MQIKRYRKKKRADLAKLNKRKRESLELEERVKQWSVDPNIEHRRKQG